MPAEASAASGLTISGNRSSAGRASIVSPTCQVAKPGTRMP